MSEYYVSDLGNDALSGLSQNSAFATLNAAIKAMAANPTADTTYLLGGIYYLNGFGVSLTDANSDDTITAYPGSNPVISGGTAVPPSGWSVGAGGIWTTQLSSNDVGQLTVGGRRQTLARYPKVAPDDPIQSGWLWAQALPNGGNPLRQMAYNPADFLAGHGPTVGQQATVFDANNWSNSVLKIAAIDTTTHVITFDGAVTYYIGPGSRYFLSGSKALLNEPGEWYFDQVTGTLYFNPPSGFTGAGAVVSGSLSLLNITNAENITIKGLTFSDAATDAQNDARIDTAAVNINSSTGIAITGNHFINVAQGVRINGRSNGTLVSNNDFSNIWAQSISVMRGTSHNHIAHNSIQNSGEVFAAASAVQLDNTLNNIISNNQIRNVPRSGISDVHSDAAVRSGANVIEHNTIAHSGQVTDDSGAIYVASPGASLSARDVIRYNTVIDTGGLGTTSSGFIDRQHDSAGIYVDAQLIAAEIAGNIIQGATLGGVYLHDSSNDQIRGNIITEGQLPTISDGGIDVSLAPLNGAAMSGNAIYNNTLRLSSTESSLHSAADLPIGLVGHENAAPSNAANTDITTENVAPVRANNWAPPLSISNDSTVEIESSSEQSVSFAGGAGTLKLDDALAFTGQVSGLAGSDALDLADVSYGADTTVTFLGNTTGGTLTVSDGSQTANIDLVGNYLSSNWDLSSDGSGGTIVVDPVSANDWQTLEVGAGGYVDGIDVAPNGTMVVRTDTYGAYIWNGTEWQQLVTATSMPAAFVTPNANTQGVYEIQIAPSSTNVLYMMYEGYVFRSTNDGTTWTETNFAQVTASPNDNYRGDGEKMAVDPSNPDVVYVGTPQNGLLVTTDGGVTWQSASAVPVSQTDSSGNYPGIDGIEFDPALGGVTGGKTNTIFAASYGNGVYESTNAGASWVHLSGGPTDVVYAAVSSTGVYYAAQDNGTTSSLWSYANGQWTELYSNVSGWVHSVAVNPQNPSEIVFQGNGGGADVSYDGGATWSGYDSNNELNATDIPWLATTDASYMSIAGTAFNPLVPNELIATSGVGVWTTDLPTAGFTPSTPIDWTSQSIGINQLVANEIIAPPGGDPVLASWDRPFFYISDLNEYAASYSPNTGGTLAQGWSVDYASSTPTFIVGIADWYGIEESGYSTNGGQTWTVFPSFPAISGEYVNGVLTGQQQFGGTIAASTPENIIWAPSGGVDPYYTLNGGETWIPITLPGVSSWSGFDWAYYLDERTVTADRVLPNTFYLYYAGNGVYETTNGGVTWTQEYSGVLGPESYYNAELQSVPGEAGNLFFTGGPLGGSVPSEGFYQSTDGGAAWTAVANASQVNCFGFGAAAPGQSYPAIYIVGYVNNVYGIWQSINDAQSWTQIGTYPENSLDEIKTISGDPNIYGQVYVGFSGSGYAYLPGGPLVSAVTASPSTGIEGVGTTITLTLTMTEVATVTGTPTLSLNDGGTATYSGGSGTGALTFSYTVGPGQSTSALAATAVDLNAATITDGTGNAANLSLTGVSQSGPQIDTITPTVSSLVESPASGDLDAGKTVTLTLNLSEAVIVAGGTPTLTLNDGGTASYTGGSGTNTLTFTYTVGAGQNTSGLAATAVNHNSATVADGAGNAANLSLSGLTQSGPQIVTTAPAAPVITDDTVNGNDTVTLTGTAQANSTIDVFAGSTELGTTTANANGAWSYTTGELTAGNYTFAATATDAAGNTSAVSKGVDPTIGLPEAPALVSFSPDTGTLGDDITNAAILALTGTAAVNSTVEVFDGSTELGTTTANASGAWSFTTDTLANGAHSFTAIDAVGVNASAASAALNVTVDTAAPAAPVIANGSINANDSATLSGTAAANSALEVFDGSTELGTTTANNSGAWSYTTGTLANGVHGLTATDTDVAGNVSVASAVLTMTVGSVAPAAPIIVNDTISTDDTVTLVGTTEPNSKLNVFDGSTDLGMSTANGSGVWSYTTGTLAAGTHSFTATDTIAGNESSTSAALTLTVNTTDPTSSDSAGHTHGTHALARGLHSPIGKLIDGAALDDIFGTSNPTASHHSADLSASPTTASEAIAPSDGFDSVAHAISPGTGLASNATDAPKPDWSDAGAIMHSNTSTAPNGLANVSVEQSSESGAQTNNSIPTETNSADATHPLGADDHSVPNASNGSGLNFAEIAFEVTDAFVFKPDLGDAPIKSSNTAYDQINPHDLFENFAELRTDLHVAAVDSVLEPSDASPNHVVLQNLHLHDFHIG